jgi:aryl-alcohol dehydrogenase-like predicted oxidoreductase
MKEHHKIIYGTAKMGIDNYGYPKSNITLNKIEILDKLLAQGIYLFDTSPRYNDAEALLGRFIRSTNDNRIEVNTKVDLLKPDFKESPRLIIDSISRSIDLLGVEQVNTIYLHQNELDIISDNYIHEGLLEAHQKKMVKNIGVSVYYPEEIEYALNNELFNSIQLPCNILDRTLLDLYNNNLVQKRIHCRSILLQGIILNDSNLGRLFNDYQIFQEDIMMMNRIAKEENLSLQELAYAYVGSLKEIDGYIIGSTNFNHIESAIIDLNKTISVKSINKINLIASRVKKYNNPKLWNL